MGETKGASVGQTEAMARTPEAGSEWHSIFPKSHRTCKGPSVGAIRSRSHQQRKSDVLVPGLAEVVVFPIEHHPAEHRGGVECTAGIMGDITDL